MAVANPTAGSTTIALPEVPRWVWPLIGVFILAVYIVGYDQGALLQPFLGAASHTFNYIHEFVHDARHLLAFPCH